jgi:hypothetical protein
MLFLLEFESTVNGSHSRKDQLLIPLKNHSLSLILGLKENGFNISFDPSSENWSFRMRD